VNVSNELEQIRNFFAKNAFIAVLEKLSMPVIFAVELLGVAGEKRSHDCCNGNGSGPEEHVDIYP